MAGQLSPDDRLTRLRRAGLLVLVLAATLVLAVGLRAWQSSAATPVRCVVRPEVSVHGVVAGSAVRLNGVAVGRVVRLGLWTDPATGRVRPEIVLSLDAEREPSLRDLRARIDEGLRAEFIPVNPASGFLEVDLVWSPGGPRQVATADADEVPWRSSAQQSAVAQAIPIVQRLAAEDLRARVDAFLGRLAAVEARVAEGPRVTVSLAERAARLRAAAARVEAAAGPDSVASAQARLGDLREGLRVAEAALDALDRDLEAWPGPAGESLRAFSRSCRASAARLRREVPEPPER